MDKLRAMRLLVKLADLGSFTRVAEQLNVSKSMISKEISRLEAEIGTRLLHRSTRNVQLTPIGLGYLQKVRDILAQIEEADDYAQDLQSNLRGRLKINAPMALGITDLSSVFADFMAINPDIELDIHLGDEAIDLVEQGFDLGFRASSVPLDSTYVGRSLTSFSYRLCASPTYIENHQAIMCAADLIAHNCFVYRYFKGKNLWPIDDGVAVRGNLVVNNTVFMLAALKRGLGIGFIPDFVCRDAIEQGELVEILPQADRPNLILYALYPSRHFVPAKLVECIDFLQAWFINKKQSTIALS